MILIFFLFNIIIGENRAQPNLVTKRFDFYMHMFKLKVKMFTIVH